ncbi:MAG: S9 family peptidase [Draconibacterium sp.]|nr:MAG: S9 family peptidase [Draconibacterium sp.]
MQKIILFFLIVSNVALAQQQQLTLSDAILGRYYKLSPENLKGLGWQDENTVTYVRNDTLYAVKIAKGTPTPVICANGLNSMLQNLNIDRFTTFPKYQWLNPTKVMVSQSNRFLVFDLAKKQLLYKIDLPKDADNKVFSKEGRFVCYTEKDNLFLSFADGKTIQITNNGGNGIVNGSFVHRKEFGINGGIFISPKGNFVAFYRKDETMVHDYPLVDFMLREAETKPAKYPMAGMTSEQVKLGVYEIKSGKTVFLQTGTPLDHYLTNIAWSPDEKYVYIEELNREQNNMWLNTYDVTTGKKARTLFEEQDPNYVEPQHPVLFSMVNPGEFYWQSRRDGWNHLYKFNTNGNLVKQITNGEWEVTKVLGFDKKEKYVFIEATKPDPLENQLYRVDLKTGDMLQLSQSEGVHHGIISPDGGYIIDSWSGPEVPRSVDVIFTGNGKKRNLLTATDPLAEYQLGENKLVAIQSADGVTELAGRIILPVNFDPAKKYPVIVYVYGGPHSQIVDKSWQYKARWWQYYMASQGYIAFTMDNRGTSNRGRDFETCIHGHLGVLETEDQMKGIEYLKALPYVDADRIGVHGWSYGGFMTLNLMLRHPEVFKVGVAGGPVVDWSLYEVMYGERYMDTPQENPDGYQETNMLNYVAHLQGKLMLIHGVQDETVVMQHSMQFLRECVKQGKQVDFFAYPTHQHNVRGKDRVHLMRKVSDYFIDNL